MTCGYKVVSIFMTLRNKALYSSMVYITLFVRTCTPCSTNRNRNKTVIITSIVLFWRSVALCSGGQTTRWISNVCCNFKRGSCSGWHLSARQFEDPNCHFSNYFRRRADSIYGLVLRSWRAGVHLSSEGAATLKSQRRDLPRFRGSALHMKSFYNKYIS